MPLACLTEAQKQRIPEFRDKWTRIGLCTQPADRDRAERAIAGLYSLANLKPPRVIWLPCPLSAAMSVVLHAAVLHHQAVRKARDIESLAIGSPTGAPPTAAPHEVWHAIECGLYQSMYVGRVVEPSVKIEVENAMFVPHFRGRTAVDGIAATAVAGTLQSAVDTVMSSSARSCLRNALSRAVRNAARRTSGRTAENFVRDAAYRAVQSAIGGDKAAVSLAMDNAMISAVDRDLASKILKASQSIKFGALLPWRPACYDFYHEVLGASFDHSLLEVTQSCGYYWTLDGVCFASERSCSIHLDEHGMLHSETCPSISYPSGWGLWHWHGMQARAPRRGARSSSGHACKNMACGTSGYV